MQRWMYLEVWRWGIFLAGVAPVYWLSEAAVHAASVLVESQLFSAHNAMLMAMAVSIRVCSCNTFKPLHGIACQQTQHATLKECVLAQRPASRLIRAALLIMLFVVSFRDGIERPELVQARPLQRLEMQQPCL